MACFASISFVIWILAVWTFIQASYIIFLEKESITTVNAICEWCTIANITKRMTSSADRHLLAIESFIDLEKGVIGAVLN